MIVHDKKQVKEIRISLNNWPNQSYWSTVESRFKKARSKKESRFKKESQFKKDCCYNRFFSA